MTEPPTTAVVGAGPAGLLFVVIGKILMGDRWNVALYDKREEYVRTHRLRMAPEPYLAIQRELDDPRFDRLIEFLTESHFTPEVNQLEAQLSSLLAELGVKKSLRHVTSLDDIDAQTVVGADSVRSTVREIVRGPVLSKKQTHERVARLRAIGQELPLRLDVVDQYRLSKVLGSVVDYRLNKNGFAEVDLFLTEAEWKVVKALGATPAEPVAITSAMFGPTRAPLLRAVIQQLERSGQKVLVQSTFLLEHEVMSKVAFEHGGKRVFLVGDAGVSLPFFRGMACLASSAHALAKAHATGDFTAYDPAVTAIVARELEVVRSRARIVRLLRELVRVSALLPFPIQSWWLSAARDPEPDEMSAGAWFNAALAATAGATFLLGAISPWIALLSLPIQIGGGVAYRWTLDLERGPHRFLRRVWEIQIALLAAFGLGLAMLGRMMWLAGAAWFLLGLGFAAGIVLFERLVARQLRSAALGDAE